MAKLKVKVRCRVRHGNIVKRGKCADVPGHALCDVNTHDPTPNYFRQMQQMYQGGYVRIGGNLYPRLWFGKEV